jgi:inosine-uridine nucleoside N-ribohydrolase
VPGPTARPLIFDTDGGVDDCAALWWALTDPGVELLAITTTSGAVSEQMAAKSVLKVLAAAGRLDLPVAVGEPGSLGPGPALEPVPFIHGLDGQGNADHPLPVQARPVPEFGSTFTSPDCPCHDLFAMLAWADPSVLTQAPELPLAVVTTEGPAWGATIADSRAPVFARIAGSRQAQPPGFSPWRVALGADVRQFRAKFRHLVGS